MIYFIEWHAIDSLLLLRKICSISIYLMISTTFFRFLYNDYIILSYSIRVMNESMFVTFISLALGPVKKSGTIWEMFRYLNSRNQKMHANQIVETRKYAQTFWWRNNPVASDIRRNEAYTISLYSNDLEDNILFYRGICLDTTFSLDTIPDLCFVQGSE